MAHSHNFKGSGSLPLLLTVAQAQELLGIGRTKLFQLRMSGELPFLAIGRSVRIPLSAIQAYIEKGIEEARP